MICGEKGFVWGKITAIRGGKVIYGKIDLKGK
jgi:hypothetical protein